MRLLDAHCHLHDIQPADWPRVRATLDGIGWAGAVVNGAYPEDWPRVRQMAEREAAGAGGTTFGGGVRMVKAYGVHPWHLERIDEGDDWLRQLRARLDAEPEATIGEIGIDHARHAGGTGGTGGTGGGDGSERTERVFLAQVDEAALRGRPMTVHCVRAHDRLWALLKDRGLPKVRADGCGGCGGSGGCGGTGGWLLHGWSGPAHLVDKFAGLGAYFSFSACTLSRPKPRASLAVTPIDRVLMETDAPYMVPPLEPTGARRYELSDTSGEPINHPANLAAAYDMAAELLGVSVDALATQVAENFTRLFG